MSEKISKANHSQEQIAENSNDSVVDVNSETVNKKTVKSSKFSEFFEIIDVKDRKDDISGLCKLCAKSKKIMKIKMKNRNTSGLKKQLSALHKNEFQKLFPQKVPSTNITNFFQSGGGPSSLKNKNFSTATVDWICKKYLPFSFFEDKDTQDYFQMINPTVKFPSRFTIRRNVEKRFKELQTCVKDQLRKCTSKVSFTIDGWTSIANRSFYGITIHFIDNEWNYQSMVLDFVASHGKHTGHDIAQVFHKSINEYSLTDKIQGITVDNATANTKFMLELQKLLPNFDAEHQHFRCMAHVLNLGVQDLMKSLALNSSNEGNNNKDHSDEETDTEIESDYKENKTSDKEMNNQNEDCQNNNQENLDSSTSISKICSIFTKIRRSEKLNRRFHSACKTVSVSINLSPILDCPTRWNSTHDMIGVALKLKQGIVTLCNSVPELNEFRIIEEEWVILEKIHKFLINFKNLLTKLGGDKYVTLPFVIVSFNRLLDRIETVTKQLDSKSQCTEADDQLILGFQAATLQIDVC